MNNGIIIRKCRVAEIFGAKSFCELREEYTEECALPGLTRPDPDPSAYEQLEQYCPESFDVMGAFGSDGEPVGFVVLVTTPNPHYGKLFCSAESFFVRSGSRKTGVGLALMLEAKKVAKGKGAVALRVSARTDSRLDTILRGLGAQHTNSSFMVTL